MLEQKNWLHLGEYLDQASNLSHEDAARIRKAITLAPERTDYRDRWYFKDVWTSMRIAKQRFQEDGLLFPFGYPRKEFDTPNRSIYLNVSKGS